MRLKLKAFRKFYLPCLLQDAEDGAVSSSDVASSNVVSAITKSPRRCMATVVCTQC